MGKDRSEWPWVRFPFTAKLLTRDFTLVWCGQVVAQVGDGVSKLALLWFVYSVTGSPLKTSIIGVLQTIPAIALAPLIGVAVDRLPKKTLLIASDLIRAVVIGLIPCWISGGTFTVEYLYILVMLHAVATAVFGPALTAAIPSLVTPTQYTSANALLQSTTSLGIIMGPALSGIGIALLSSKEVLCLNAATYVVSALCFLPIRMARPTENQAHGPVVLSAIRDIYEGLRYVVTQPIFMFLTAIAAMYTFGTAAFTTLFPVFGRTMLDLGPIEVGYLWSMLGVGLLIVSLALTSISSWTVRRRIWIVAVSSIASGAALFGLVWVRHPVATGALLSLLGAGIGALTPIAWGVMQELTPPVLLGRALAFYSLGAMGAAMAGITFFGWVTERFDAATTITAIGSVMLLTAAMAGLLARYLRETPMRSKLKLSPSNARIVGN